MALRTIGAAGFAQNVEKMSTKATAVDQVISDDALWYKDAVIYQIHVRAFQDSNGDGIGDFRGLTSRLDYLSDLGVTTIWLLPFYPSPLKDDGYDIADYTAIHPAYGTLADFTTFLKEAHKRGLRVITELVINHTSDQHPWFQRARRAPKGSWQRDFYVWSDSPDKYAGTRIIFKDFEPSNWTADPVAGAYYWHRFYYHQPDLNFDNPRVRKAIFNIMEWWLKRGVDGLRLDAVPYLYEREGTNCENLPETHAFLKDLRKHIDTKFRSRMLLAEANQWPDDAVAYFGNGDECHMAFNFPIMPRLFMALRMENRFPIVDILNQTPSIPEKSQWAMFLRNHDELTLEMVTDRERDYMYQVYARDRQMRLNLGIRRRLAPLLGNERRAIELMNSLLLSLKGTPVIYYGDEIGMGDNVYLGDRNGVRTPMQWNADRNAGFSWGNPQRLFLPIIIDPEYHYEAINVETQQNNPRSLLWWTKRMIHLRRQFKAFGRGDLSFVGADNNKILAFLRCYEDEVILVVVNLSRYSQSVMLDLSDCSGMIPMEIGGQTNFPTIGEQPYPMTLGPYDYYWFALQRPEQEAGPITDFQENWPVLRTTRTWEYFVREGRGALERILPRYLYSRRWFGGKARKLENTEIAEVIRVKTGPKSSGYLLLLRVEYSDSTREKYVLPLTYAAGQKAEEVKKEMPGTVIALVEIQDKDNGVLYDALFNTQFTDALINSIRRRKEFPGDRGNLTPRTTSSSKQILPPASMTPAARVLQAEQSNTSIFFGNKMIMKLFRRVVPGTNPDFEIGHFLKEKAGFTHCPPVAGALEYKRPNMEPSTIAIVHGFIENQGDAWQHTLDYLFQYYELALATEVELESPPETDQRPLETIQDEPPELVSDLFGLYLEHATLLGRRSGEFHKALACCADEPDFAPEPFTVFYRQSQYQAMRVLTTQVLQTLKARQAAIPEALQTETLSVLALENAILQRFAPLKNKNFTARRIRTHGDFHLGQVLFTGKDFVIMDFEGEPARSLSERRAKVSPLRDIAGMLRSFHYASFASLYNLQERGSPISVDDAEPWRKLWCLWTSSAFLKGYLEAAADAAFIPDDPEEFKILLDAYTLEKALYELGYELNNRPEWIRIPLEGILEIMQDEK